MNARIEFQTIVGSDGKPAFVLVPYEVFLKQYRRERGLIPNEVVGAAVAGASMLQAWREYLHLTQTEIAERIGVTQAAYAQMEKAKHPRKATLERVAGAMGLTLEQLA